MKKLVFVIVFGVFSFVSNAQDKVDYIKKQIQNVEVILNKKGENLKLNNSQKESLTKIFEAKHSQVEYVYANVKEKSAISKAMTKIEDEYQNKVSSVLNAEQRLALKSRTSNKKTLSY